MNRLDKDHAMNILEGDLVPIIADSMTDVLGDVAGMRLTDVCL